MKIYLGADHRGYKLKEELKKFLAEEGYEVEDLGAFKYDQNDDYPDFARQVAERVASDPEHNRGVLLCGSGAGMDIAANKVKKIRATLVYSEDSVRAARNDDDVNVISLAADVLSLEETQKIAEIFLKTPFEGAGRFKRRLQKISEIEQKT